MKILDRLPYSPYPITVDVRGEAVRIKPYQIIVQVSVSLSTLLDWDERTPKFPAILDPGNNHNFSVRRDHMIRWAGLKPDALPPKRTIRERQHRVPLHAAGLWVHPNVPGEQAVSDGLPHLLKVEEGIAIHPNETGPRLPVLGLRALTQNNLHLTIAGRQRLVWLRTPDWYTRLLRWFA